MMDFNAYVLDSFAANGPLLQPRQGFSTPEMMRAGLMSTARSKANTVCTITLDAFTRVNDLAAAQRALDKGQSLNGYPIINHPPPVTRAMIDEATAGTGRPVQIRHGSPNPVHIVERMAELGLSATEGGPVSYCLPYSRTPLREAFSAWRTACRLLSSRTPHSHIESFAGCMMGQMCDPSILVALNILEGLFLRSCGIETVSLSYAQGISPIQDRAAVTALQRLAQTYLHDTPHHLVAYVFMGFFPRTMGGFCRITHDALAVVKATGIQRVILKTPAEARRIPTITENTAALEYADFVLRKPDALDLPELDTEEAERVFITAQALIEKTLALDSDISEAILSAFQSGVLSVPYCLHPDNRRSRGTIVSDRNFYYDYSSEKVNNAFSLLADLRQNIRQYDHV